MKVGSRKQSGRGGALVLEGIDWRTYTRLLRAFEGRPGIRLTYDQGRLEIMSPRLDHEQDGRFLARLVVALTEELDLPLLPGGSATLRRQLRQRGIEADESFWIANASRMQGRRRLDLRRDPPPDLAIEVDVTHSSLDRLAIYAALGVPEVWRLEKDELLFHVLNPDGNYSAAERSQAFPIVKPGDLMRFVQQALAAGDQNPVVREFRAWIHRQRGAGQRRPSRS
jgi:Uma2 family endonuclease